MIESVFSTPEGTVFVYFLFFFIVSIIVVTIIWIVAKIFLYSINPRKTLQCRHWACLFFIHLFFTYVFLSITLALWNQENPLTIDGSCLIDGSPRSSYRGWFSDGKSVHNWGESVKFEPRSFEFPHNETELIHLIQKAALDSIKVRAVGGSHSYAPLLETDGYLVSLDKMNRIKEIDLVDHFVCAEAGLRIYQLNRELFKHGFSIRGFGSIQGQSLGGGLSTSLHGATYEGFADYLISARLVISNGTVLEVSNSTSSLLKAVRSGIGCLGIISEVCLRIHPIVNLIELKETIPLPQFLESNLESKFLDSEGFQAQFALNMRTDVLLETFFITNGSSEITDFDPIPPWEINAFDNFIMPITTIVPSIMNLVDISALVRSFEEVREESRPLPFSWQHYPRFGLLYVEYCVPLHSCMNTLRSLIRATERFSRTHHHPVPIVEVRLLKRSDEAYLGFSYGSDACTIELYNHNPLSSNRDFYLKCEEIIYAYGGRSHWGQVYFGDTQMQASRFPEFNQFNAIRTQLDPSNMFVNDYTGTLVLNTSNSHYRFPELSPMYQKQVKIQVLALFTWIIPFILTILASFLMVIQKIKR